MTPLLQPGWLGMNSANRNLWSGFFGAPHPAAAQIRARVRWRAADDLWVTDGAGAVVGARGLAAPPDLDLVPGKGYVRTYTTHWKTLPSPFTVWIWAGRDLADSDFAVFD